MKWILMVILFAGCLLVGYLYSNKYKKRVDFFNSLIYFAQKLDVEINFSRERLKKLVENFDEKAKSNLQGIDISFLKYLNEGGDLTAESLFKNKGLIKKEEKEVVTMFFKNLGRSDVENQTKEIKNSIERFEKLQNDALMEYKKFGKLGIKLGIIAGLALVIILI